MTGLGRFDAVTARALRHIAKATAFCVVALCLAVLTGYVLGIQSLVTVQPGLRGMATLTAVGLLALAISLLAEAEDRRRLARAAGWCALGIGLGMLAVVSVTGPDLVSPYLAEHLFSYEAAEAGRMSPATAVCLATLALAGLVRDRARLADGLAALALVISGTALLGYAYGVRDLYAVPLLGTMALHTAIALFGLAIGSVVVRPDRGWAAVLAADESGSTRRQLAFTLVPPVAGSILLRATDAARLGPSAAIAFLVAVTIAPLAYLILRDGRAQIALDAAKRAEAAALLGAARDMEAKLAAQALDLERAGAERVKAEAIAARSERMEAVGQLTGGIAHDFNNLLMAIGGNLELIARRLPDEHPTQRYVRSAIGATERGAKLTGQLLAFSRTQRLDIRSVEIDPVLDNARALLGNALGPTIDVDLRLGAPALWVTTDPDQLDLAILNLAVNARDAMQAGGRLTIESGPARERIEDARGEVDCVSVRVSDTGEGMPPEIAARAVEPFFTTKQRGKGTGLGLAQVYGFARQCGGDLRITSAVGNGTTIEILLPRTAPGARNGTTTPATKTLDAESYAAAARRLVLVVDDDESVRTVMADALRDVGFTVAEARDGPDGLAQLETIAPAAAIIDFIMPGMNGAEVARRAQLRRPGLPIVFVSGYFDTVALDGISGAVVLRKPFDVEGLRRSLSAVLH